MSPDQNQKSGQAPPSQTTAALSRMFKAIIRAITNAHTISETQHLNQIRRYSDPADNSETEEEQQNHRKPKTMQLKVAMSDGPSRVVEVPLLALSPPSTLALKELQMEFQVQLMGVDDEAGEVEVQISQGGGMAEVESAMAKVKVTVAGVEPPDSVSRIIELLTQQMI